MERLASSVRREAVGFDRDPEARPREIEPVAPPIDLDRMLPYRLRQPAPDEQAPHLHLEPGFERRRSLTPIEDLAQHRSARTAVDPRPQNRLVRKASMKRGFECRFQDLVGHATHEVDQGSGDAGSRDSMSGRPVGGWKLQRAVHTKESRPRSARHLNRDLDLPHVDAIQIPQETGGPGATPPRLRQPTDTRQG